MRRLDKGFRDEMQARLITALVTPMDSMSEVDFAALEELIRWQVDRGTEGVVLCGSTGEGSLLTAEEKFSIFERGVLVGGGAIEVIANVGGCSTRESVLLAKKAKAAGVDGVIAIVPYYVKPTDAGCFAHFSEIAKVGLPLLLYHHPGRTGTRLSATALLRLAGIPGVVGIKEASGDLSLARSLIDGGVSLFSGDDALCHKHLQLGARGSISIVGNLFPDLWKRSFERREVDAGLDGLCHALTLETNPQCVKYALSILGKCQPHLRLPLLPPGEVCQEAIRRALQGVGRI